MKPDKGKPILLAKQSEDAYLDPQEPIILLPNGNIQCGNEIYKSDPQSRHQYPFIRDYLKKRRLPLDISKFRRKELIDIVEALQSNNRKSISLKKLLNIVAFDNQIVRIKEYKIRQIKHIAYKRYWKRQKLLLNEKRYEEVEKQNQEFEERRKIVHRLINHL